MTFKETNITENILGWYGAWAILLAYVLLQFSVVKTRDLIYQLLNLTGALGIIAETWGKRDFQPLILNVVWGAVALVAILSSFVIH